MTDQLHTPPDDPREAAAWWFSRVNAGQCSAAQLAALHAWRQANSEHDKEYRAMEQLWQWADRVPASQMRTLAAEPRSSMQRRFRLPARLRGGRACRLYCRGWGAGWLLSGNWHDGKKYSWPQRAGKGAPRSCPMEHALI